MASLVRLGLSLTALALAPAVAAQAVFINEIHYDNAGADEGEAIEVAGPAGASLAGWDLVLYNGSNGAVYSTVELSGVIPDQGAGAGTVAVPFPANGLQNGSPDGVALVDDRGDVVQFLSYEGTMVAVGGPADGMTSQDIGVAETSATPVGESLQLVGTGSDYGDFTWTGPTGASFGEVNEGQALSADGGGPGEDAPRLVVNEVDYDQPGTDAAEYVELYNGGTATASLGAYELVFVNGTTGSTYQEFALPAVSLAPGEFFVVCGDAQAVANCDFEVSPSTNLIQNGAPDAVALRQGGEVVDALSYEGSVPGFTEGTGTDVADSNTQDFVALSRLPDGADTDNNAADFALRCGSPGAANAQDAVDCPSTAPVAQEVVRIHDVQGSGASSPLEGQSVIVEGVVVGDFQGDDGDLADLGGFYVQEEDADADADEASSEGLFVFVANASVPVPDVTAGDVVRVTGTVVEFGGLTELTSVTTISVVGTAPLPAPVEITLPLPSKDFLERYEGMAARLPQALTISEYASFDRFGEVVLALPRDGRDRLYQPTAYLDPAAAAAVEAENDLRKITLDDGRATQNADPARHPNGAPFTLDNRFRGGDLVENAVGVLDDRFGKYRLQPTAGADYTVVNPRTEQPDDVGGTVRVAGFNVLNYFNGDGQGGGFPTSRGADDPAELARQTDKIVAAIGRLDAAVVGVIEVENDPDGELSALDDLVDALNAAEGDGAYDYVQTGVTGTDEIKSALVYRPGRVTPVGDPAVLLDPAYTTPPGGSDRQKNRPVVAQTFEDESGEAFTVAVVHLRSKGGSCGSGNDDPVQGSCNGARTQAAEVLVDWLAGDPTGSGDPDVLIVGDLNAYDEEDPVAAILEGADDALGTDDDYVDLVERAEGEFAYSYAFDGEFGYLDYALATTALADQVTGATVWHINADEPDILDYDTSFKQPAQAALYEPNPYRASDHDPVLVGLSLGAPAQAVACSVSAPVGIGDFDADGSDPAYGEFAELVSGAPVDLSTCSFVAFNPFTERVTYSARPDAVVDDPFVFATRNGDALLPPGALPDGPGAIALVEGAAPVGTPVASVLGRVVSAVVYFSDDRLVGRTGYREARTASVRAASARTGAAPADLAALLAEARSEAPEELALTLAGPNPVRQGGAVSFALPDDGPVTVTVFDVLGREVVRLVDATLPAGTHRADIDAGALPSGSYILRLTAGPEVRTVRVTVVR